MMTHTPNRNRYFLVVCACNSALSHQKCKKTREFRPFMEYCILYSCFGNTQHAWVLYIPWLFWLRWPEVRRHSYDVWSQCLPSTVCMFIHVCVCVCVCVEMVSAQCTRVQRAVGSNPTQGSSFWKCYPECPCQLPIYIACVWNCITLMIIVWAVCLGTPLAYLHKKWVYRLTRFLDMVSLGI